MNTVRVAAALPWLLAAMLAMPWAVPSARAQPGEPVPATAPVAAALKDNLRLMVDSGLQGTPGIVYQDAQGRVQVTEGMPSGDALSRMTQPKRGIEIGQQ